MIVQVTEIREGGSGDDISYIIIDTEALRQVEPYENDNGVILDFKFYADVLEKETSADEEDLWDLGLSEDLNAQDFASEYGFSEYIEEPGDLKPEKVFTLYY